MCKCLDVYVCVHVWVYTRVFMSTRGCMHVWRTCVGVYMCECVVCVCVCVNSLPSLCIVACHSDYGLVRAIRTQ